MKEDRGSGAGVVDISFERIFLSERMELPKRFPAEFKRDVVAVARRRTVPLEEVAADSGSGNQDDDGDDSNDDSSRGFGHGCLLERRPGRVRVGRPVRPDPAPV